MVTFALMCTIPLWGALVSSYVLRHFVFLPLPPARVVNGVVIASAPQVRMWPFFTAQVGTFVLMTGGMAALMVFGQPAIAARYKREMLRLPRCPWCIYDLTGTPVESGSRTCPECGGGWSG